MAATRKPAGRAASVALARKRMRDGASPQAQPQQPQQRASATIPATVLSVVPAAEGHPAGASPSAAPVSSLARLAELQREGLRRLDSLERLVQVAIGEIRSLRRDLGGPDPDEPAPIDPAAPTEPDAPAIPEGEPTPGEPTPEAEPGEAPADAPADEPA